MVAALSSSTVGDALSELIREASARKNPQAAYAGDVWPQEAFHYLAREGGLLVDVRTVPEWQFVGMPDMSGCIGRCTAISWKIYPDMSENPEFAAQLAQTGVSKDTPIFFMCRGGGRSAAAAAAMTAEGYRLCFNVATGFEGEANAQGHRGRVSGWQGAGLPWKH